MVTAAHQPSPQRKNTRSQFLDLPAPVRRPGDLLDLLRDPGALEQLAESVACAVLPDARQPKPGTAERWTPDQLAACEPADLRGVRRPVNHQHRQNRNLLIADGPRRSEPTHSHAESGAEAAIATLLRLGCPGLRLRTQFARLEWTSEAAAITHVPDFLFFEPGVRWIVDVTSTRAVPLRLTENFVYVPWVDGPWRLPLERVLKWELTALLCDSLGWRYAVLSQGPLLGSPVAAASCTRSTEPGADTHGAQVRLHAPAAPREGAVPRECLIGP